MILDLIANRIHGNYMQIITWSGEIDVKISRVLTGVSAEDIFRNFTDAKGTIPEAILQKTGEKIKFAIDANKEYVYIDKFRERPSQYLNNITGKDLGNSGSNPYWSTSISRSDFFLEAKANRINTKEKKISRRKAVKRNSLQKDFRTMLYKGIDDPRKIFVPGAIYVWEHHKTLIERISKTGKIEFDGYKFQIEEHKKGSITEYKIIQPSVVSLERKDPNDYIIQTKIYSSQYGFNIIYWEVNTGGGEPVQQFSYEYELINGVYLPKRVITKHYGSERKLSLEKDSTYINNKINKKIPAEKFEYMNLNLKEGDIFIDEILNKEYRYKAATHTLKEVEK